MNGEFWLGMVSLVVSFIIGVNQLRISRRATDQSSEVTLRGQDLTELQDLRDRVTALETREQRLWAWARRHLDLYYRFRVAGAPDPEPLPDDQPRKAS